MWWSIFLDNWQGIGLGTLRKNAVKPFSDFESLKIVKYGIEVQRAFVVNVL